MKNYILILWSCIICLLGCSKSNEEDLPSPTLEINAPSEIVFKADATCPNSTITVTTNQSSWTYSLNPYDGAGWLSVQQSGNTLKLTAKKNDLPEERKKVFITISAGNAEDICISARQLAQQLPDDVSVTPTTSTVSANASNITATINCAVAWKLNGGASWCVPSKTSGAKGETISISIEENETIYPRSCSYAFETSNHSATLTITQQAKPFASIECSRCEFDYNGGSFTVTGKTNIDGVYMSCYSRDWLILNNEESSQDNGVTTTIRHYSVVPYDEYETRTTKIFLTKKYDNSFEDVVATISQTGLPDKIITFIDPKLKVGLLDYQNFQFATGFWIQTTGDLNIDTNSDGEISLAEAYPIYDVRCQGVGISSVDDIQNFPNVSALFCNNNVITSIDLSNHKSIGGLYCYNNRIESLNVSNTNIRTLDCSENYIANLDISNCYNLYDINCDDNNIQSLDLTNCAQLQFLSLRNNPITFLTLSGCTNLAALSVGKDGITIPKLDLSGLAKLQTIICMGEVSSLIIGPEHSALTSLSFSTDKSTFDCSFCDNLSWLVCSDSPNLSMLHLPKNIKILNISRCNFQQLDLSNCPYLEELECASNKIQELDLSNCPYLKKVNVLNNPIKTIWLKEGQNVEIVKNSNSDIEIKYKN